MSLNSAKDYSAKGGIAPQIIHLRTFVVWKLIFVAISIHFGTIKAMDLSATFNTVAKGQRLDGFLIYEKEVYSLIECALSCLSEHCRCKSINFERDEEKHNQRRKKCQLNSETKTSNPENLVPDIGFNYLEPIEVKENNLSPAQTCTRENLGKQAQDRFSANFTNLGTNGRFGPSSIGSFYVGKDHESMMTMANGVQHWTVPFTGTYQIVAVGASGGYDKRGSAAVGRGAYMRGEFQLNKGEVIKILVGQQGAENNASSSSGGGGGTFVVRSSNTPLIIAGGGGGIQILTARLNNCDASVGTSGKQNSCFSNCTIWSGGMNGSGGLRGDEGYSGGGGGGFYSNGQSSKQFGGEFGFGGEGGRSFLNGGAGGRPRVLNAEGGFGGGGGGGGGGAGGGGGYSGGASGDNARASCGGGGGSFNIGKKQYNVPGYQDNGHGYVQITLQL